MKIARAKFSLENHDIKILKDIHFFLRQLIAYLIEIHKRCTNAPPQDTESLNKCPGGCRGGEDRH